MAERMFSVLVRQIGKPTLVYPPQTGDKALSTMRVLKGRGFQPTARTIANAIISDLSMEEMEEIFDDEFCSVIKMDRVCA